MFFPLKINKLKYLSQIVRSAGGENGCSVRVLKAKQRFHRTKEKSINCGCERSGKAAGRCGQRGYCKLIERNVSLRGQQLGLKMLLLPLVLTKMTMIEALSVLMFVL